MPLEYDKILGDIASTDTVECVAQSSAFRVLTFFSSLPKWPLIREIIKYKIGKVRGSEVRSHVDLMHSRRISSCSYLGR